MSGSRFEFKVLVQKITEYKKNNNLTFEKLARDLEVDKSHLYRVINMKTYPSFNFLIRLAEVMQIPLYFLFVPSEEMIREENLEKIDQRIKELGWDHNQIAEQTGIPEVRIMNILHRNSSPTREEMNSLTTILALKDGINYQEVKLNLIKNFLNDLDLNNQQTDKILGYIKDNVEQRMN